MKKSMTKLKKNKKNVTSVCAILNNAGLTLTHDFI